MTNKSRQERKGLNLEFNAAEREIIDQLVAENKCSPTKAVKIALHQLNELRATNCYNTTPIQKGLTNGTINK